MGKYICFLCACVILVILLVNYIEESNVNTLSLIKDEYFTKQWGLNNTGQIVADQKGINGIDINYLKALEVFNKIKNKKEVVVGILDTGIDINNLEIKDSIFINSDEVPNNGIDEDKNAYIDDINGWDFYYNDNTVFDSYSEDYHGTQVVGIISSLNNEEGICGISSDIKILPLKFMSGNAGSVSDAVNAINYASKLGVDIISCSWDTYEYDDSLKKAIEENPQILFVCSSGKHGKDLIEYPIYPACYNMPNILTVASIDNSGEFHTKSGYGEKVSVVAPGVNVISTMPENEYEYTSGSSIAVSFVTGVAAMLKSCNFQLTPNEISEAIITTSIKTKQTEEKGCFGGIINAYSSLKYIND